MKVSRQNSAKLIFASSLTNQFVTLCQGILFVPLYIGQFGAEKYGYWLASGGIIAWLAIFDLRLTNAMGQRMAAMAGTKQYHGAAHAFGSGIKILLFVSAFPLIVLFFLDEWLINFIAGEVAYKDELITAFQIAVIGVIVKFFAQAFGEFSRSFQWARLLLWGSIAAGPVLIVTVFLSLHAGLGVVSIPAGVLAHTLTLIIFQLASVIYLCRKTSISLFWFMESSPDTMAFYRKVMPAVITSRIGSGLALKIEPLLIAKFISAEMATVFSITRAATLVLSGVINGFSGSLFSAFSQIAGKGNFGLLARRVRELFSILLCLSYVLLCAYVLLNENFICVWVGSEMYGGFLLTILIALASFCLTSSNFLLSLNTAVGEIRYSSWLRLFIEVAKLMLMILLVPLIGVAGAPLAVILLAPVVFILAVHKLPFCGLKDFLGCRALSLLFACLGLFAAYLLVGFERFYLSVEGFIGFLFQAMAVTIILVAASSAASGTFRSMLLEELNRYCPNIRRKRISSL